MRFALLPLLGALVLTNPALADDRSDYGLPPTGHTMINLSATESKKVDQDLLVSSMRIEIKNKDNIEVQSKINEAMKKAVDIAKKYDKLKVETGGYSLYESQEPIRPLKDGEEQQYETLWRGSQNLTIQSTDAKSVLEATREIQALGLVMNGLNYTLSPEKAEAARDELVVAALQKLKNKAGIIAKALSKSDFELVRIAMDGQMPSPPPMSRGYAKMEMMAVASDMAAPVAEAGESTVSITVSADALLTP